MWLVTTMSLPQQPASVGRARYVLDTLLSLTGATDECQGHLAILITEACTNAVRHATHGSTVDLRMTIDEHVCMLEICNEGTNDNEANLSAEPPDPLALSGRGLPLIAALADTAAFVPTPPGRVLLRITKHLTPL